MQQTVYTRKSKIEEKKNMQKAFLFIFLTIGVMVLFVLYGFGALAKFAGFLGDLQNSSQPVETEDKTPPIAPRFEPIPKYTNKLELELKGTTEPGATVTVMLDNDTYDALANNQGEFLITVPLINGENDIAAYATDTVGNKSHTTEYYKVSYDNIAPKLEISKPNDQQTFYGSRERQIVIEGTTEPGTKVNINGKHVVVENNGSFTFLTTLNEGENNFLIKAEDDAKNSSEQNKIVTYSP